MSLIKYMNKLLNKIIWRMFFAFEKIGLHVLPIHYFSPIPDTRYLRKNLDKLKNDQSLIGINLREEYQLKTLEVLRIYEKEYVQSGKSNFGLNHIKMPSFAPINALALYSIIRHFKPKKVIEVGAGMSTKITSAAMLMNTVEVHGGEFIVIEPYPSDDIKNGNYGINQLINDRVENVDINLFKTLEENDILFIDSSHVVKPLGDVNYLFLNVIPQLNKGVIIHVHDIFFPLNYLPHHYFNKGIKMFWQEQYLLHSFLLFNNEFEIMLCLSFLHHKHNKELNELFSWYQNERWPSSFWMKRSINDN